MTIYEELFDLKYRKGIATYELAQRFPDQISRVSEIALLDVPRETLRCVVLEKETLRRVMNLRRRFLDPHRKTVKESS